MIKKKCHLAILILCAFTPSLSGGTGRPEDGFLFFVVILGFLGIILGILYLVEYIPILFRRWLERLVKDITPSNGDLL